MQLATVVAESNPARTGVLAHRIFRLTVRTITLRIDNYDCILGPETLKHSFSVIKMLAKPQPPRVHHPKGWQGCVKPAVLHAIAPGLYATVYARAWAADNINARVRLAAENDRLHEECVLLRVELRIKHTRLAQIAPQRRPHDGPHERMANRVEPAGQNPFAQNVLPM